MSGVASYCHHLLSGQEPDKSGHGLNALPREYAQGPQLHSHFTQCQGIELACTALPVNPDIIRTYSDIGSSSLVRVHSSDNKRRWTTYRLPTAPPRDKSLAQTGQSVPSTTELGPDNQGKSLARKAPGRDGAKPGQPSSKVAGEWNRTYQLRQSILTETKGQYRTVQDLAATLKVGANGLRRLVYKMVQAGELAPQYPDTRHPGQAYIATTQ